MYIAYFAGKVKDKIWSRSKFEVNPSLKMRNPVQEAIDAAKPSEPKKQEFNVRDGILLIFHGSPFTGITCLRRRSYI